MGIEIIWSENAIISFEEIVEFILIQWTEKEVRNFTKKVNEIIALLKINPKLFTSSIHRKNHHRAVINFQTSMYYRFDNKKKVVEIQLFRDNRRKPINR